MLQTVVARDHAEEDAEAHSRIDDVQGDGEFGRSAQTDGHVRDSDEPGSLPTSDDVRMLARQARIEDRADAVEMLTRPDRNGGRQPNGEPVFAHGGYERWRVALQQQVEIAFARFCVDRRIAERIDRVLDSLVRFHLGSVSASPERRISSAG
jgi:hypothetical protein